MMMLFVLMGLVALWLAFRAFASNVRRQDREARALSRYASRFGIIDARCLNDLAASSLLDSVNRKWGGLVLTGNEHLFMCLQSFVAIRDRVDELEGRSFGIHNKSHIRNALTVAILDLTERVSYFDQREMIEPFRLWQKIPDEHLGYFVFHLGYMEHVYMYPDGDYSEVQFG